MSLYFFMRLIPLAAASLTTVVRDDSSQNVFNIESSVHFTGGFLRNDSNLFLPFSLRTPKKDFVLYVTRSSYFKSSDLLVILKRRGTSGNEGRCRLFTIFFFVFAETLSSKMINLPNVQTKTTSALKILYALYRLKPGLSKSSELLKSWCH